MSELTNLSVIRALCDEFDIRPSKGFGQNFLVNPSVCPKLCELAGIDQNSQVLEIGPGIGTLTDELAKRADRVVAIELDKRLLPVLHKTLAGHSNVDIVQGDAMKLDLSSLLQQHFNGPALLCANLPYNITSPLLMRLLEERLPLTRLTVMVQKEAAQRICAPPGTRMAGAISYAVHYYAKAQNCFSVKPGSFYPPPKVTSAVISLDIRSDTAFTAGSPEEKQLFSLVRTAFSKRRKTLANALSQDTIFTKEDIFQALATMQLSPSIRPEAMTLDNFLQLHSLLHK